MAIIVPKEGEFFHAPLPDDVIASMERNRKELMSLAESHSLAPAYFVEHTLGWLPGSEVRVAFKGGSRTLRENIMKATEAISNVANLKFDFLNDVGNFYEWSTGDRVHQGDIRICFDRSGYWSLVGTDSVNSNISSRDGSIGGHPSGRSMCFGGYEQRLPRDYEHTVRHEFMHAIGFHHEHQSPNSDCDNAFRWDDDKGYEFTKSPKGRYVRDRHGNMPGIYTYMSGYPNFWNKVKVDSNMRPSRVLSEDRTVGKFDARSIMLYRFEDFFYHPKSENCRPVGNGTELSEQDKIGLQTLYPSDEEQIQEVKKVKMLAAQVLFR